VGRIEDRLGGIDLAFLNAGTYVRFGVADFTVEAFGRQIEINVMGTVNCLDPVLARMRQRNAGHIAVVSSLTAYRGLPYASAYGASKAALTNMCEAMKPELDALGIQMTIIHPGFVKTPLTDLNEFPMPFLMEADAAARRIVDGLERGAFEITFPRRLAILLKLARCLPYGLYFAMTRRLVKT
jgi:NAD(P)-dependent dehydrogenase (short-subunit alcohol dehydrogenase family)